MKKNLKLDADVDMMWSRKALKIINTYVRENWLMSLWFIISDVAQIVEWPPFITNLLRFIYVHCHYSPTERIWIIFIHECETPAPSYRSTQYKTDCEK